MKFIKISIGVAALLALISLAAYGQMGTVATDPAAKAVVDPNGDLRVPADYRTSYQFLGSWAVADGVGQSPSQIHVVYASPGTIAAYRQDKRFADGSVLSEGGISGSYRTDEDRYCQPCPNVEGLVCNGEGE